VGSDGDGIFVGWGVNIDLRSISASGEHNCSPDNRLPSHKQTDA